MLLHVSLGSCQFSPPILMCFGSEGKASQHTLIFRHLTDFGLLLFCGPHIACMVFKYSRCGSCVLENSLNIHLDAKLLKHVL